MSINSRSEVAEGPSILALPCKDDWEALRTLGPWVPGSGWPGAEGVGGAGTGKSKTSYQKNPSKSFIVSFEKIMFLIFCVGVPRKLFFEVNKME